MMIIVSLIQCDALNNEWLLNLRIHKILPKGQTLREGGAESKGSASVVAKAESRAAEEERMLSVGMLGFSIYVMRIPHDHGPTVLAPETKGGLS